MITHYTARPPEELRSAGKATNKKLVKDIKEFIKVAGARMVIGGLNVPVLNAPYFWAAEAGHIMCKGQPFAATYYDTGDQRNFSLRSGRHGVDVSEVAALYGGGGQEKASGFSMPLGWDGDI